MQSLLPKNSTITFIHGHKDKVYWQDIYIDSCSKTMSVEYHPKLVPSISVSLRLHLGSVQEIGLFFQSYSLRFVSCHKEQLHWIGQLKDMVTAFDVYSWLALILIVIMLSKQLTHERVSKSASFTFKTGSFHIFSAFLDQSTSLFQNQILTSRLSFDLAFFFVPLSFLYLGNLYKGDNIARLTIDPPLIPCNTFDSLIKYKFKTFVRTGRLTPNFYDTFMTHSGSSKIMFPRPDMKHFLMFQRYGLKL